MSARRFKGMLCVYCSERRAVTGDHVFARGFFIVPARGNLPQVPACDQCNTAKSRLEQYLTTLLPFGGRHPDAHANLSEQVPGRLAKNLRLANELKSQRRHIWHRDEGVYRLSMTLPVDPHKVCSLFALTARALTWFYWETYLLPEQTSDAILLTTFGREYFNRLFAMNAKHSVQENLGSGTVSYRGVQATDAPQLTLWRINFYGGLAFSGDPDLPAEKSTEIGAVTGPRRLVAMITQRTQN